MTRGRSIAEPGTGVAACVEAPPGVERARESAPDSASERGPTLTQALAVRGYTHRAPLESRGYAREIVDASGRVVGVMSAGEAWAWLSDEARKVSR